MVSSFPCTAWLGKTSHLFPICKLEPLLKAGNGEKRLEQLWGFHGDLKKRLCNYTKTKTSCQRIDHKAQTAYLVEHDTWSEF